MAVSEGGGLDGARLWTQEQPNLDSAKKYPQPRQGQHPCPQEGEESHPPPPKGKAQQSLIPRPLWSKREGEQTRRKEEGREKHGRIKSPHVAEPLQLHCSARCWDL